MFISLVSVTYCQVEVFASGRSLVQRRRTECGVSSARLGSVVLWGKTTSTPSTFRCSNKQVHTV